MEKKITSIEVIGSGCDNCKKLHETAIAAAKELGLDIEVGYSNDIQRALLMGVMQFPVLAVNGEAILAGQSSDLEKVKKAILNDDNGSYGCCDKGCSCDGNC
jgi:glutaredoxin